MNAAAEIAPPRMAFADLTTDELLERAKATDGGRCDWNKFSREMLLAFFHNRHGRFVPDESAG